MDFLAQDPHLEEPRALKSSSKNVQANIGK